MSSMFWACGILLFTAHVVLSWIPEEIVTACKKEIGFDDDIKSLDYTNLSVPNKTKCFLACLAQKGNAMSDDGAIDKAKAKEFSKSFESEDVTKIQKAIDECDGEAKGDKCETAFQFNKCIHSKVGPSSGGR